jgi:ferritin-like metal-binding protein YciE
MATITEPRQLLANELQAMLYVEQKLADDVLPELERQIANEDFRQGITEHLAETKQHVANVARAFELLGEEPKADKSHAIDGLVAQHDKVIKNVESQQLRDVFNAGAAAKTEHLEIAAYESMITTAESIGEEEIVTLLEENLDQEKDALKQVEKASKELASETAII